MIEKCDFSQGDYIVGRASFSRYKDRIGIITTIPVLIENVYWRVEVFFPHATSLQEKAIVVCSTGLLVPLKE